MPNGCTAGDIATANPEVCPANDVTTAGLIFVATDGSGGTMAQYEIARDRNRPTFVPPATIDIEPNDGLPDLRAADDTTPIQSVTDLTDILSTTQSQQKNLDEWT